MKENKKEAIILGLFKQALIKTLDDNCMGLSKEIAYSFLLSFFPMLLALVSLFFVIGNSQESVNEVISTLTHIVPKESHSIVIPYVATMAEQPPTRLFWFSLLGTLWTASGVICSLQNAFNVIYAVKPKSTFWKRRLVAFLLALAVVIPILVSTTLTIFASQLELFFVNRYRLQWREPWIVGHWIVMVAATLSIAAVLYRAGVERKQSWKGILPGAVVATFLWLIIRIPFNLYVKNFGSYNRVYGSLGAVIVLLIWMFVAALILLYGAEFNYQVEKFYRKK